VAVDGGTGIALDFEEDFDALTPRFILDYQVRPDNKLYAIAARGTKPGGFNGALAFELGIGSFEEETLWQFELGSKNLFFDRQVLVNLAGYFSLLDGYQLTENLAALGATTTQGSAVSNLGEVEIFGLELDTSFTPNAVPGLTLRGNYAFTDAEFTEGTEETQQAVFGEGSLEGQELPRQARHQAAFFIDYEKPFTEDLSGFFSVNGSYLSSRFAQVQNLAETGDSFELAARATLFWRDRYSLTVYGENLNDEDAVLGVLRFIDPHGTGSFTVAGNVIENAFNLASDGQSRGFQVNNRDGRRWGVILRYQF
jgi:outer membrane receptor protein involved in Fe transport